MKTLKVYLAYLFLGAFFFLFNIASTKAQITSASAILNHPQQSNILYIFSGDKYYKYDWNKSMASTARSTASYWPGLPSKIDAALKHPTNKNLVYLFSGQNYYRFNWATNKVDMGPKSISQNWPGLPSKIDAALNHPTDKNLVYLFSGSNYYRFNWSQNRVDVGPKATANAWPGLPSRIDAAVNHATSSNYVYLFSGNVYYRFNWSANKVDSGYPMSIAENWKAPSASYAQGSAIRQWFASLPASAKEEFRKANITASNVEREFGKMSAEMQSDLINAGVPTDQQIVRFVEQHTASFDATVTHTAKDTENFFKGLLGI